MDRTSPNPNTLESLHALAEHVVAAALYAETGRIGLRVAPGGFSTPPFNDDRRTSGSTTSTLSSRPPKGHGGPTSARSARRRS
jgi:hypothetical protein